MKVLVRFWVMVLSAIVGLTACGYLFFSFFLPGLDVFATSSQFRLVVTFVGAMAVGVFLWATFITDTLEDDTPSP